MYCGYYRVCNSKIALNIIDPYYYLGKFNTLRITFSLLKYIIS